MICPQCGYDMGTRSKCLRCGYEEKTLVVVDEKDKSDSDEPKQEKEEKPDVKIIDPCNVYLTHPYGVDDDSYSFGSPFASIFDDLFGDPIGDLLGGLFGINFGGGRVRQQRSRSEEPQKRRRKQGPIVEIDNADVEILDENNKPVKKKTEHARQRSEEHTSELQSR